jgi:hypothetical protein
LNGFIEGCLPRRRRLPVRWQSTAQEYRGDYTKSSLPALIHFGKISYSLYLRLQANLGAKFSSLLSVRPFNCALHPIGFRFNNRKNPYLFRDTMHKLIDSPNLQYKDLTAKVQDAA